MTDIEALRLLTKELQSIQSLPNPPPSIDGIELFEKTTKEVIDDACDTTQKVATYGEAIDTMMEKMRSALNQSTTKIKEQIKKALDSITGRKNTKGQSSANAGTTILIKGTVDTNGQLSSKELEYISRLQNLEMNKNRLEEFIIKTQQVMEKVKKGASVTNSDIEQLRGCLGSWLEDKKESYQEEQDRLANERNKQEEEKRKLKEEEERKRKEEEKKREKNTKKDDGERRKKDEDERLKRDEEERLKREEEERKRKEEEDRKRKEEEDQRNKEEQERLKREEEERKRKEDEDRKKKEEEDRINKEMERKRREEEERKKREAQKKEEEERRRKDPANWTPLTYRRPDGESDSFHRDIYCHVFAMPDTLQEEDLECFASDEWRDNEDLSLGIGEKVASSFTEVKVKEAEKDLKVPMRICVPHCSVSDSSDEVIVKVSIDGGEWTNQRPVTVPAKLPKHPELNYAGIDVANFHTVKLLTVAKTRSQDFLVDKNGIGQASTLDKNIKLFVPRDTFRKPKTNMKLEIRPIRDNSLSFATQYYDHCHNVLSTSSVMTITCEALTEKDIELDLTRNAPNDKRTSDKGRYFHLYKCRGDNWKTADSEMKGKNNDVSIKLPSRKDAYVVLEIEGRLGIPNEEFLKAADELYFHSNASIVRIVAKQRADNPYVLMIQCVRRDQITSRMHELERQGFSIGPDTSKEFALIDGQAIILRCSGNITMTPELEVKLIFHAYMDTAKQEVTLQALDEYKQKEFEGYVGHLQFEVLKDNREGALYTKTSGSLPITLPKRTIERPRTARARIRFPHYLTTLAKFLALKLTFQAKDDTWLQVIFSLGSRREMENIRRRAATRCETPNNEYEICEIILQDWMKSKPVQEDKIKPIIWALQDCHRMALSDECEKFIHIHKMYLSDECMSEMAKKIANDWSSLARKLGLSEEDITSCKSGSNGSNEEEAFMMLCKWRVSEAVINSGIDVFNDLLGILETVQNVNGLKEYVRHILNQISKD